MFVLAAAAAGNGSNTERLHLSQFRQTPYDVYVQSYGKVKSGTKLTDKDYAQPGVGGSTPFDQDRRLAVSLAAQDVKSDIPMRSTSDFADQLKRLKS